MEGEGFGIVSWKIDNFSYWNQTLHGKCIQTPEIYFWYPNLFMKLYPRGTSGKEERMVVHLLIKQSNAFSGDLSFINADGFTFCTQRIFFEKDEGDIELPPGPKFEEVIVKTRGNNSDHKDQLTVMLLVNNHKYDEFHLRTSIQVFDVFLGIDRNVIQLDGEIISYIRSTQDNCDIDMCLKTGKIRDDKTIELLLNPLRKNIFSVNIHLRLISWDGSVIRNENNEHMFHGSELWAFSDSLSKGELSESVRLFLDFKIISGKASHTLRNVYSDWEGVEIISSRYLSVCMENNSHNEQKIDNDQENAVGVLLKELKGLYQDQDFSDLQLKCESVSFPVHRNILSARSNVFKAMLSSDMAEAATGCVDVADLEAPTLARFLAFLYTGVVQDLQGESALKLYYAADKYHVPSLKRECVSFLRTNVCVSNVCDVLSLGDKHRDDALTAAAHNFLLRNFNSVLKSNEWKNFMRSEPLLALKTVTDFAEKDYVVGNFNAL